MDGGRREHPESETKPGAEADELLWFRRRVNLLWNMPEIVGVRKVRVTKLTQGEKTRRVASVCLDLQVSHDPVNPITTQALRALSPITTQALRASNPITTRVLWPADPITRWRGVLDCGLRFLTSKSLMILQMHDLKY